MVKKKTQTAAKKKIQTSVKKKSKRRKPGRPKEDGDLRDVILNHAEMTFADEGFSGTKIREIATSAGVNPALIRYYFSSKANLFNEVFHRRGGTLARHRNELLEALLRTGKKLTVEELIHAFLKPQWDMKYSGPSGAAFVRLQARLHAEPEEHALRLRGEVYNVSVRRFITEFSAVLPGISRDVVSVRMAFMVGTYLFMLNDLGRLGDLTEGHIASLEKEEMLNHLIQFLAAGMRTPVRLPEMDK